MTDRERLIELLNEARNQHLFEDKYNCRDCIVKRREEE